MNTSAQRSIPPHLRENIFRSYEDILIFFVRHWPEPTSHACPVDITFVTFCAGIRNAINSVLEFEWKTELDIVKLRELRKSNAFVVAPGREPNTITFRPPGRSAAKRTAVSSIVPASRPPLPLLSSSPVPARDMTEEQIRAFVILLDAGLITGPVLVRGRVPPTIESLSSSFNVFFTYDEDKHETIIT